jgi:hypothetical protein
MNDQVFEKLTRFESVAGMQFSPARGKWMYAGTNRTVSHKQIEDTFERVSGNKNPHIVRGKIEEMYSQHGEAFERHKAERKSASVLGATPLDHFVFESYEDFIETALEKCGATINEQGNLQDCSMATLRSWYIDMADRYNKLPKEVKEEIGSTFIPAKGDFDTLVQAFCEKQVMKHIKKLRDKIRFNPDFYAKAKEELDRLTLVLTPEDKRDRLLELNRAALEHMIHQVKRKIFDLPVEHHMMVYLKSLQGSGKTELMRRLGAPLGKFFLSTKAENLFKAFNEVVFSKFYLMCLDEFSVDHGRVNDLKRIITQEYETGRAIFSQNTIENKVNTTFVATSNDDIKFTVGDFTGMRRFWQVDCTPADADPMIWDSLKLDWATVNDIDYDAIWIGVDENLPSAIADHLAKMREYQDQYRMRNRVEEWLEDTGRLPCTKENREAVSLSDVYDHYIEWCQERDQKKPMDFPEFTKLAKRGTSIKPADKARTKIWVNKNPVSVYDVDVKSSAEVVDLDFLS